MATYSFRYIKDQSGPYGLVIANNDKDASEAIREFIIQEGGTLMPGTIVVMTPPRTMPDPEWAVACGRAA